MFSVLAVGVNPSVAVVAADVTAVKATISILETVDSLPPFSGMFNCTKTQKKPTMQSSLSPLAFGSTLHKVIILNQTNWSLLSSRCNV